MVKKKKKDGISTFACVNFKRKSQCPSANQHTDAVRVGVLRLDVSSTHDQLFINELSARNT